jgi:hypothetical protein
MFWLESDLGTDFGGHVEDTEVVIEVSFSYVPDSSLPDIYESSSWDFEASLLTVSAPHSLSPLSSLESIKLPNLAHTTFLVYCNLTSVYPSYNLIRKSSFLHRPIVVFEAGYGGEGTNLSH